MYINSRSVDYVFRKRPAISNWKDLKDQFGSGYRRGETLKTAAQLVDELAQHIESKGQEDFITVPCHHGDAHESIACFRKDPGNHFSYSYEGTAS